MFSSRSQIPGSLFSQICKQTSEVTREYVLCLLETNLFTSISTFNINNGEVHISQFFDSTNYSESMSVLHRFNPKYVLTSESCQNSLFFTRLKQEFVDAQFYVFQNSYFQDKAYKGIFEMFLQRYPEVQCLAKSRLSILYNCLGGLLNFVKNQFQYQMNKLAANVTLLQLQDVLIYNPKCIQALNILQNTEEISIESLIKPVTSGGQRLLRANLIQPLNQIDLIQSRQNYLNQISQITQQDRKFGSNLKDLLRRFKSLDQITLQLSQVHIYKKSFEERCVQTHQLMDQILKIIEIMKNLDNITQFISSHDGENKFVQDKQKLMQSEDPDSITQMIDEMCESSILQNLSSQSSDQDEKIIFVIKSHDNQLLKLARSQYTNLKSQLRTLLAEYQSILQIDNLKYKIVQKNHSLIFGNMLVVPKQFSELQLRQKLTIDNDAIHIMEVKGKFYHIITERLVSINLKIQQTIEEIMNQTSLQVFSLYQNIQQYSGWIFKVNELIGQLDVTLAMAEYTNGFEIKCFPEYTSGPLIIQKGFDPLQKRSLNKQTFNVEIDSLHNLHLIYDPKDTSENFLKRLGQFVILSQIGCMVPSLSFRTNCFSSIMTKFKSQVRQNLCENESSFTQELGQLNFIYNQIKQTQRCTLVICDQMVVSSAHEENIALNITYFERVNILLQKKDINFICATNQTDNLLIFQIQRDIDYLFSDQTSIKSIQGTEVEDIIKDENNEQFNKDFIEIITNDVRMPHQLCQMLASKLQEQEECQRKKRKLTQMTQESLLVLE